MARRLKTIAAWINANMPGYEARIEEGFCNTDYHYKGSRLRRPGKGREGNRLIVTRDGKVVKDHNSAETYRYNQEVEDWLARELRANEAL